MSLQYRSVTLVPAYGRDYKSKATLLADWTAGLDFRMSDYKYGGSYTSIRDLSSFIQDGVTHLHFRYSRLTKIHVEVL